MEHLLPDLTGIQLNLSTYAHDTHPYPTSKACGSALAALLLIAAPAADASFSVDVRTSGTVPDLPDPAGRAGMVAGTVTEDDGSQSVIAAGAPTSPGCAGRLNSGGTRPQNLLPGYFQASQRPVEQGGNIARPAGLRRLCQRGQGLAVAGGHNAQGILKDALLIKRTAP